MRDRERFGVNVLSAEQEPLARLFASKLPEEEKFAGVPHTVHEGIPVIDGALAWVGCRLEQLVPGGDHTIGIGAVRARRPATATRCCWSPRALPMTAFHIALGVGAGRPSTGRRGCGARGSGGAIATAARSGPDCEPARCSSLPRRADGAVLVAMGEELPDLHLIYGLTPLRVSFLAEQLRLASADSVLQARGPRGRRSRRPPTGRRAAGRRSCHRAPRDGGDGGVRARRHAARASSRADGSRRCISALSNTHRTKCYNSSRDPLLPPSDWSSSAWGRSSDSRSR